MEKILVTYQIPKEGLKDLFEKYDVTYPDKKALSRDEVVSVISQYDGMIAAGIKVDREMLDAAKKLKIISNYGVGYDNIDVKHATKNGVIVTNTPESVTEATAEIAFGLMLSLSRRITECDRRLRQDRNFKWGMMNNLGYTLFGKSLGIVGMGRIGKSVARRAVASGMKVCYHNRTRLPSETEATLSTTYLPLDELLKVSDIISVHTPLTPQTYHLIGEKEFRLLKPTAFIINTARGTVIDEGILVDYLMNGKIAGAGLDVFEKEPAVPEQLLGLNNVVLTPHIGTEAVETRINMAAEASQNIISYFRDGKADNVVNSEALASG